MSESTALHFLPCPLCGHAACHHSTRVHSRDYRDCPRCRLAFMNPRDRPSRDAEAAHYRLHDNRPDDPGYRRFLRQLAEPLISHLDWRRRGLDYGCGPGPTLSILLEEHGCQMSLYDPFFAPDSAALRRQYDFVTCSETAEHFHHPADEFARLHSLLRPGGILALMTQPLEPEQDFPTWWYLRDPTHVSLYRPETLTWIAHRWQFGMIRPNKNVWLLRTPS